MQLSMRFAISQKSLRKRPINPTYSSLLLLISLPIFHPGEMMMARLTQAQWRALIEEQAASGQTAMAFCAERGIDNKYFSTRKSQLTRSPSNSRFVAITKKPLENQNIQLHIGAAQLHIPANVSPQWLSDVIKALA
jgi:hypothetical protein